ncbi:MAG: DEAD/DEAH box helicase family protein, partial [bacterium]
RGGKFPRIKRLSEFIGQSYFDYLAGLQDLVLIMDESHRYRASAGVRAINELRPVLGLELTATPNIETSNGHSIPFKNVIYDYPLGKAMEDGFVKEPAVVTRKDFNPAGMSQAEIERLKLEDGVRLHESVKVELETYARETGNAIVKPFLLVISRDTTHAGELVKLVKSDEFFGGNYAGKVIQVDSSRTGAEEEEMIERLLKVEHTDEPTEIVIHVNMLKEGWDVTNLYTIVPLRAANARTLIEQSIGRGLRLPYGKRTGITAVDRLNIVAHDKFQEIVDEASRPESVIHLQQVILDPDQLQQKTVTVVSEPNLTAKLVQNYADPQEQQVAQLAYQAICKLENKPQQVPGVRYLIEPDIQAQIVREVEAAYRTTQLELDGVVAPPDFATLVAQTSALVVKETINIPRITVVPKSEVKTGFKPFTLDLSGVNYQAPSDVLLAKHLLTGQLDIIGGGDGCIEESRIENYVVSGLVDFDDVSYDNHADLLFDLAGQVVLHLWGYLSEDDTRKVLRFYQRDIARLVHSQMQDHYWEDKVEHEVKINSGFTPLKPSAYTASAKDTILDYRHSPADKSNMARYLFGGFSRCLYKEQKFQSDSERKLAIILDRDADKWFKPAKGQFQIHYKFRTKYPEYQPDFVAETKDTIYMLEPKARNEMDSAEVLAKRDAALTWCQNATVHANTYNGKPWVYALIPHDIITENMSLEYLVANCR